MFTGIIEEKGRIIRAIRGRVQRIEIQSTLKNSIGDSISVQGVCLTVVDLFKNGFSVETMEQTQGRTTIADWKAGDEVNLERALQLGGRIGGHIILGHVDEVCPLIRISGNEYFFKVSNASRGYLIPRGSIAINGVSLTIGTISQNIFSVFLIPQTLKRTTLANLRVGNMVNIEYDYIAKILSGRT